MILFTRKTICLFVILIAVILGVFGWRAYDSNRQPSNPPPPAEVPEAAPETLELVQFLSPADGAALNFRLELPTAYNALHSWPLYFCGPGTGDTFIFPATSSAILAATKRRPLAPPEWVPIPDEVRERRPPAPAWLTAADASGALEFLLANYSIDRSRCYLVVHGRDGLEFACRNAAFFSGVIISFPDQCDLNWSELPLENLTNIPVFINTSRNQLPPVAARQLKELLGDNAAAPEYAFASSTESVRVEAVRLLAAEFFARKRVEKRTRVTWQSDSLTQGTAWWLKISALDEPGQPAAITAELSTESGSLPRLTVTAENVSAWAFRRDNELFPQARILEVLINGSRLLLPPPAPNRLWQEIRCKEGSWELNAGSGEEGTVEKCAGCEGPIGSLLHSPFVIVYGTLNSESAEEWRKSAEAFAEAWGRTTGLEPPVAADVNCTAELLQNRHLLLFGSPEENSLTAGVLGGTPTFLQKLFASVGPELRVEETLACVTLHPAGAVAPGKLAAILLTNSHGGIAKSWQPMLNSQQVQDSDFALFNAQNGYIHRYGWLTNAWDCQ